MDRRGLDRGRRKVFDLDLDDVLAFPDWHNIPLHAPADDETWIFLGEVRWLIAPGIVGCVDKTKGTECHFSVGFFTRDGLADARACEKGYVIAIHDVLPWDGRVGGLQGFKIADDTKYEVLPCSMDQLREIHQSLRRKSAHGELMLCNVCKHATRLSCAKCAKTRYCGAGCQKTDWPHHKRQCKVIAALHGWNRTEFW